MTMKNQNKSQRVSELNGIFDDLINDAKDFASDMTSSVYLYFFAGILTVLFGVQTGWYNRIYILNLDLIPLVLMGAQIVIGCILIIRGFNLKSKYSRIFALKKRL